MGGSVAAGPSTESSCDVCRQPMLPVEEGQFCPGALLDWARQSWGFVPARHRPTDDSGRAETWALRVADGIADDWQLCGECHHELVESCSDKRDYYDSRWAICEACSSFRDAFRCRFCGFIGWRRPVIQVATAWLLGVLALAATWFLAPVDSAWFWFGVATGGLLSLAATALLVSLLVSVLTS